MVVDQAQIETLLDRHGDNPAMPAESAATAQPPPSEPPPASAEVQRLMKIRVPVIVELMRRPMAIGAIRRFSQGTILEFEKHVNEPLSLRINNRPIGTGEAVRVDEKFGLRILSIDDAAGRIRSMGP
jgi:flagellar motor switch protein FliN